MDAITSISSPDPQPTTTHLIPTTTHLIPTIFLPEAIVKTTITPIIAAIIIIVTTIIVLTTPTIIIATIATPINPNSVPYYLYCRY